MIIKCGWHDSDTTNYLEDFLTHNMWSIYSFDFREEYEKIKGVLINSQERLLNDEEKEKMIRYLYICWEEHIKTKCKDDYEYLVKLNPNFEIVDSVSEKDYNGEVVFSFVRCGGQCIVM